MGYRVSIKPSGIRDLEQIKNYVAQHNASLAESLRARLVQEVKLLAAFPRIGRAVPEMRRDLIRELVRPPYRIVYRLNEKAKTIEVLRFWHAARGKPLT